MLVVAAIWEWYNLTEIDLVVVALYRTADMTVKKVAPEVTGLPAD